MPRDIEFFTEYGLLDEVSARLSTKRVTELVGEVVIHGQGVAAVARDFLAANALL